MLLRSLRFILIVLLVGTWLIGINFSRIGYAHTQSLRQDAQFSGGLGASESKLPLLETKLSGFDAQKNLSEINDVRQEISRLIFDLRQLLASGSLDARSERIVNDRISALQSLDKQIERELRRSDTRRQVIQTELNAVRKVIADNVNSNFKYID